MPYSADHKPIIVGRINGIYGVGGEVKVFSHTRPREQIFSYSPWLLRQDEGWAERQASRGDGRGKGLTARIEGVDDRDLARGLIGIDIAVSAAQLPDLPDGEFYWHQLLGMEVITLEGEYLGKVSELEETGANDVLVVQGKTKYLVPYVKGTVVRSVDPDSGRIQVDWDPEYF